MRKHFLSNAPRVIIHCLAFLFFLPGLLQAQQIKRCGTAELLEAAMEADPALEFRLQQMERNLQRIIRQQEAEESRGMIPVYTIPVVFHILFNNHTGDVTHISDDQVLSQLEILNADYRAMNGDLGNVPAAFGGDVADVEIEFCLAAVDPNGDPTTGITRTLTSVTVFHSHLNDAKFSSTGGHDIWDRDQYLNIWVVPGLVNADGDHLLGYAQFPGTGNANTDGVVVVFTSVGSPPENPFPGPYNAGRTATHEIGHWLNLKHIWGDDCPGENPCSGTDNCADTPNQECANYGCPAFPHLDQCSNTSPGVMFMNYMDYVDDDCMIMFTNDQRSRMRATLTGFRSAITISTGCCPVQWIVTGTLSGMQEINYRASGDIQASADIQSGTTCVFQAGSEITFTEGFHAVTNTNILAVLDGCATIHHAQ